MSSPNKLDKKEELKNEDGKISSSSLKRSNSMNVVTSPSKSLNPAQDNNRDSSKHSQILLVTSFDNTNDKKNSPSPRKKHVQSSNKKSSCNKLTFRKKFVEIINVQSFKKFNLDLSYNDPSYSSESSKCRCQIY